MAAINIKFPEQHYVGFQKRTSETLLGFMTPYGTDSAAKKRMESVDSWARGNLRVYDYETRTYREEQPIPSRIYDNSPLEGFIVGDSVNHGGRWGNSRDKWRVEDPRGFELEITSGNFEEIISSCTIIEGKIQEPCIWARMGALNILVPTHIDLYQKALKNTEVSKKKASIKDAKPGDLVTLQNGVEGIYMGYFYVLTTKQTGQSSFVNALAVTSNKKYVFKDPNTEYHFFAYADARAAEIHPGNLIEDPVGEINKARTNPKFLFNMANTYGIVGVSDTAEVPFTIETKTVDTNSLTRQSEYRNLWMADTEGYWWISLWSLIETHSKGVYTWQRCNSNFEYIRDRSYYWTRTDPNQKHAPRPPQILVRDLVWTVGGVEYRSGI